ncbi:hypothetical protein [Streptomyces flavofungini]|uniref:hypothetical protein n=1 Tax=Streptomyces flavofungini TaxID=68200 RepID=UPI0034DF5C08
MAAAGGAVVVAIAVGATVYTVTSDEAPPLNVDFVLGGGDNAHGSGNDLRIQGNFRGLAVSNDDTVHLFTEEDDKSDNGMAMWRKKKSGAAERVAITGMSGVHADQAAVAPDGSVYLAGGGEGLWKVGQDGRAANVVAAGNCLKPNAAVTPVDTFCANRVSGVTVAEDGTVYFADGRDGTRPHSSYVHRLDGESIRLVAGRPPKAHESTEAKNPAVRNGFDPKPGTKATDVLVPDTENSGSLAATKKGIYWKTGPGIVRINKDDTLSPLVAARKPSDIDEAQAPFSAVGHALDAAIPNQVLDSPGGLSALQGGRDVYYADMGEKTTPSLDGDFRWGGVTSASQKRLLDSAEPGGMVHRVAEGELAPVIAGVQALATSEGNLYVAVKTDGADRTGPKDWDTAVVKVRLRE